MSRGGWLAVVGAGALAAAGFLFVRSRLSSAAEADRIRALEERLALLEKQGYRPRVLDRRPEAPAAHLVVPAPAPMAPVGDERSTTSEKAARASKAAPADEVALQREYFTDLDVRLSGETPDPAWSASTEEKLRNSVRDLRPRITVDKAQCGQTMCRVETTAPDPHEDAAALDKFVSASLALMPEVVVRDGDGPGRHVVYLARKGTEFPPMNAPEVTAQ